MKFKVLAERLGFFQTLADTVADGVEVAEAEQLRDLGAVEPLEEAPLQNLPAAVVEAGEHGAETFQRRDGVVRFRAQEGQADLLRLLLQAFAAGQLVVPAVLRGLGQPAAYAAADAFTRLLEFLPQLHDRTLEGLFGLLDAASAAACQPRTNVGPDIPIQLVQGPAFLAFDVRAQLRDQHGVRISTLKQPHPLRVNLTTKTIQDKD
jgi:hypothetical protein